MERSVECHRPVVRRRLACRILMFLKLVAMYSSAFVTVVISLDRQAAVLNPLGDRERQEENKVMLCVAWVLSFLLAIPQLFIFHTVSRSDPCILLVCYSRKLPGALAGNIYNMFTFFWLFLLPLLIMVSCYTRILLEISHKMKEAASFSKEFDLRRSSDYIPRVRIRTLKMSLLIVLTFIVCWTPYYLLGIWYWFSPEMLIQEKVPPSLCHILFLFGLFHTCLDPSSTVSSPSTPAGDQEGLPVQIGEKIMTWPLWAQGPSVYPQPPCL
ncbi:hypothetical protein GDO86_020150 [Hymenochirus boettgeri]|uniref:G-protein coupled receptors family 1 profile domain-containing protein n=1 Tax=Hymenochirus boettgeri TaxID=247094 RepID=A0A8T2IK57_9PIPI|nr:hypothetical protein GDO86_020150 [Hymenochirus boettgeri]